MSKPHVDVKPFTSVAVHVTVVVPVNTTPSKVVNPVAVVAPVKSQRTVAIEQLSVAVASQDVPVCNKVHPPPSAGRFKSVV